MVAGTSSTVPSSAASSRPNANAPGVPGPASGSSQRASLRATSAYPSPYNKAQPSTNTTATATAGSSRRRRSRAPETCTASVIRSSGKWPQRTARWHHKQATKLPEQTAIMAENRPTRCSDTPRR